MPFLPRLHYAFHPESGRWEDRSCPVRDMGTAADLATLQRHLPDRHQYDEVGGSGLEGHNAAPVLLQCACDAPL